MALIYNQVWNIKNYRYVWDVSVTHVICMAIDHEAANRSITTCKPRKQMRSLQNIDITHRAPKPPKKTMPKPQVIGGHYFNYDSWTTMMTSVLVVSCRGENFKLQCMQSILTSMFGHPLRSFIAISLFMSSSLGPQR